MSEGLKSQGRLLPLIIATGLFMENLDSTVLSTALPTIARDFGTSPIYLKLTLTSYLLSLAIFIPTSGWMADRLGPAPCSVPPSWCSASARLPAACPPTSPNWWPPASCRAWAGR